MGLGRRRRSEQTARRGVGAVNDAEELARLTGLPLLYEASAGVLEQLRPGDGGGYPTLSRAQIEAARSIGGGLRSLLGGRFPRSVVVCEGIGTASSATVGIALATTSALEGRRTLLVDLDFRDRPVAAALGLSETPGIGDYLNKSAPPPDLLQAMEMSGPAVNGNGPGRLVIIGAGGGSPTPMPPFTWERFSHFVEKAGRAYEFVVLSGEPLLAPSQPSRVIPLAEAAVVCARPDETSRAEARAAWSALRSWTPPNAGLVAAGTI